MILSLVLMLGFALSLSASATNNYVKEEYVNYDETDFPEVKSDDYKADIADLQFDRLMELLHGDFIAPFALDDEPITVPNVNMFAPPEGNRNYFIIGVESAPTQECIDFILSYTGIPRGRAYIGEAYFVDEYEMVCLRDIHWDINDGRNEFAPIQEEQHQEIMPLSTVGMGQMAMVVDFSYTVGFRHTIGHPTNVMGRDFLTSVHHPDVWNFPVYLSPFPGIISTRIATIDSWRSFVQPSRDIAQANMLAAHSIMPSVPSIPGIPGGLITNFRGQARVFDSTVSVRGMSGPHVAWVESTNWQSFDRSNKIATYPNGFSQDGDSGAALIRTMGINDRAVLGTRRGRAVVGTRTFGIYTNVANYGW
ncbi:MAG: hypothetical protein FWF79_01025 [Defluviitaleaceae bacterium]|nr:hypothetical protein [Defluviitaleaceae bacterium]